MADRRARFVEERRAPQDSFVYDGVGASLRHVRERLGLDVADVAQALRIQLVHLEALEGGRFQELPGPAYAIGFIRSYARYLRLDGEAAVAQFKAETAIQPGHSRLVAPEPIGEVRRPRGLLIGASLVLAAAVYGGWTWLQERGRLDLEAVPPPPVSAPAPEGAAGAAAPQATTAADAPAPEPAAVAVAPAAPAASPPAPLDDAAAAADEEEGSTPPPTANAVASPMAGAIPAEAPAAAGAETAAASPAPAASSAPAAPPAAPQAEMAPPTLASAPPGGQTGPAPQVYGLDNQDARVVLRAREDSWVRVRGANNELYLERTLRRGDTYLVPNRGGLTLWTGNAGGLEVIVDGAPLPPLGASGVARRDIPLDPDRLRAGG